MGNLFSYENPIMQALMKVGDLIILNFLFLLCCFPIFTIGAAQAGLFTAAKVMQDKEDDSSLVAAFFRGFKSGFGTVTLAWGLMMILMVAVSYAALLAYSNGLSGWICFTPIVLLAWFIAQIPAFHSRFGCTALQLIRNVWFLIFAHPLRTIFTAAATWFPLYLLFAGFFTGGIELFLLLVPIWITLYFSTAASLSYSFLKKPFNVLIDHFNQTQNPASAATSDTPAEKTLDV